MGSCHNCGAPLNHRRVKQDFWIKEKLVVVENVPAAVCGQCGERIVNATTARRVLTMLSDPQFLSAAPTISVPRVRYKLTCG
jgi:YgiT-type zinc finger domain-containing protein